MKKTTFTVQVTLRVPDDDSIYKSHERFLENLANRYGSALLWDARIVGGAVDKDDKPASTVPMLLDAIQEFERVQAKYADCGARDTEPCTVFQGLLIRAFKGKKFGVPRDGAGWHLYTLSMDCAEAANALCEAALNVVRLVTAIPNRREVREFLQVYIWRV